MTNSKKSRYENAGWTPGIRLRLAKLVVGCVLPLAAVAAFLIFNFYRHEQAELSKNAINRARTMIASVDRGFAGAQTSLRALASSRELESGDLKGFHLRAFEALQEMHADSIVLIDTDGQLLLATNRAFGQALPKLKSSPLLSRVMATERAGVADLFTGPIFGQPIYAVGIPVEYGGKMKYMLLATAAPGRLTKFLTEQNFPDSWRSALTDSTGTIVARTHDIDKFLGAKMPSRLLLRMKSADEGAYEGRTLDGKPVLTAYCRSPLSGWMVVIGMPLDELTSGLRLTLAWLIAATASALVVGISFAWLVGGRIAQSIAVLGANAKALGEGAQPVLPALYFREAVELGGVLLDAADTLRGAQYAAHHDALTALPNRALFRLVVNQQLALCQRNASVLTILYIDLDGFKAVNDTFGHTAGDQLLCAVSARIREAIRESDIAARLGGDEFAVALMAADIANAAEFAAKLIGVISAPYRLTEATVTISASIGLAGYPASAAEIDTLLGKADRAMYDAKKSGKKAYCIAGQAPVTRFDVVPA